MSGKSAIELKDLKARLKEYLLYQGVRFTTDTQCHCFAHEDGTASMSVRDNRYKCFACGASGDVIDAYCHFNGGSSDVREDFLGAVAALGDMFRVKPGGVPAATVAPTAPAVATEKKHYRFVRDYFYTDAEGEPLYKIERHENEYDAKDKQFYPRVYDRERKYYLKSRESYFKDFTNRVPFRLPDVNAAILMGRVVFFAEGEKCAEALEKIGLAGTCVSGGVNGFLKCKDVYAGFFKGAKVCVLPDNDAPGRKFAAEVARAFLPAALSVRIVDLNESIRLPEKGDVVEWLELGGSARKLNQLYEQAPQLSAEEPAPDGGDSGIGFGNVRVDENRYVCAMARGGAKAISNFIIVPLKVFKGPDGDRMNADFHMQDGKVLNKTFSTNVFVSKQAFKSEINDLSVGYTGGDDDLTNIKLIVEGFYDIKVIPSAPYMGICRAGAELVFVNAGKTIDKNGEVTEVLGYSGVESPLAITENSRLPPEDFRELLPALCGFNERVNVLKILGFVGACFLKYRLDEESIPFPHLGIFGVAGAGKTQTVVHVINPIFSKTELFSAGGNTKFSRISKMTATNIIPVILDEYKPSLMDDKTKREISELLRTAYNGVEHGRGNADYSTMGFIMRSPLILMGEESISERATVEREVTVSMNKNNYTREMSEAFTDLKTRKKQLAQFGYTLLLKSLASECPTEEFTDALMSRGDAGTAVITAGLKFLNRALKDEYRVGLWGCMGITCDEAKTLLENSQRTYANDIGANRNIADNTMSLFFLMIHQGVLRPNFDYLLKDDRILMHLHSCYIKLSRFVKDNGLKEEYITGRNEFCQRCQEQPYYVDVKQVTFHPDSGPFKTVRKQVQVFDLRKIRDTCGIELFAESPDGEHAPEPQSPDGKIDELSLF